MERKIALRRLAAILGKKAGYRVNAKAPTPEERAQAKLELTVASANKRDLEDQLHARRQAVLAADPEYQRLLAANKTAREGVNRLQSIALTYKITVGTSEEFFFHVKAEGDSWEEIFDKLDKLRVKA